MCCSGRKRAKKKIKKYKPDIWKTNQVHPLANEKVDKEFIETMSNECLSCNKCKGIFTLRSEKIKIHCASCEKFYHCGIAGGCIGVDCSSRLDNGTYHRLNYCNSCAYEIYKNGTCLCKDCKQ